MRARAGGRGSGHLAVPGNPGKALSVPSSWGRRGLHRVSDDLYGDRDIYCCLAFSCIFVVINISVCVTAFSPGDSDSLRGTVESD